MHVWGVCVLVRLCFYFYGESNLQLRSRRGYFRQEVGAVSSAVLGAGISGAPCSFVLCVLVVFFCVGVKFSLWLWDFWFFSVTVGGGAFVGSHLGRHRG